ncbi:pyridoxamine 5-phosphate oxidase [Jiella endophytica]|uniref:Pyridoxamine 5-phosphate oxidase n=1 Tax=Jiella endophytica TaxID=2558362 RepID=A0A4Y8RBI8_9HYPH|nr:pyridoxamine 5'-phosphate oxidase family protein [Jiella endophytica]TFF19098.1 pyridoxamine 5-phosphate oxidase [Jiella endophytica]
MAYGFLDIAATPSVKAAQAENGSLDLWSTAGKNRAFDRFGDAEAAFIASRDSFYMATVSQTGWPYLQHRGGPAGFLKVLDDKTLGFADFRGNRQYISLGNLKADDRVSLFLMDYPRRARLKIFMATVSQTGWPYLQHRGGPAGFLKVLDDKTLGFADFRGNRQYISLGNLKADDRVSLFLMDYPRRARLKIFARAEMRDLAADADLAERLALPDYRAKVERAMLFHLEAFDWNCPQHITPRFTEAEISGAVEPLRQELRELKAENDRLRAELAALGAGAGH